MLQFKIIKD